MINTVIFFGSKRQPIDTSLVMGEMTYDDLSSIHEDFKSPKMQATYLEAEKAKTRCNIYVFVYEEIDGVLRRAVEVTPWSENQEVIEVVARQVALKNGIKLDFLSQFSPIEKNQK